MTLLEVRQPESERIEREISQEEISALIIRAQSDDADAFAEILRCFQARLHRQAYFLTGHEQQALDLLQETSLQTWKNIHRYDGRAGFFTWMCSIMLHRHYDWLRRLRTRAAMLLAAPLEEGTRDETPSPRESAERSDNLILMRECLEELPARQRTIVYLRFYAGESLEGIAAIVGCSLGTVKSRLFHALRRLAKMQKMQQVRNER